MSQTKDAFTEHQLENERRFRESLALTRDTLTTSAQRSMVELAILERLALFIPSTFPDMPRVMFYPGTVYIHSTDTRALARLSEQMGVNDDATLDSLDCLIEDGGGQTRKTYSFTIRQPVRWQPNGTAAIFDTAVVRVTLDDLIEEHPHSYNA